MKKKYRVMESVLELYKDTQLREKIAVQVCKDIHYLIIQHQNLTPRHYGLSAKTFRSSYFLKDVRTFPKIKSLFIRLRSQRFYQTPFSLR